ncbi:unnamed protein product [Mesocestoides corti]|uniref:Uncharacterized protein n=1 Tax=Mesocestoides corti TaxID=53468 RepID=A0A0R3UH01_MESCO|nr:unnamed protein product [Mesocestoides corti]
MFWCPQIGNPLLVITRIPVELLPSSHREFVVPFVCVSVKDCQKRDLVEGRYDKNQESGSWNSLILPPQEDKSTGFTYYYNAASPRVPSAPCGASWHRKLRARARAFKCDGGEGGRGEGVPASVPVCDHVIEPLFRTTPKGHARGDQWPSPLLLMDGLKPRRPFFTSQHASTLGRSRSKERSGEMGSKPACPGCVPGARVARSSRSTHETVPAHIYAQFNIPACPRQSIRVDLLFANWLSLRWTMRLAEYYRRREITVKISPRRFLTRLPRTMNAWFPFGYGNNSGAADPNTQQTAGERSSDGAYDSSISRTPQFWGQVTKETNAEQQNAATTVTTTAPLMSAAAAVAQSFFSGASVQSTAPLNSLLTVAAANQHQVAPTRVDSFGSSRRSPESSAPSEQSVPSPHRNYFSPTLDGYQQGFLQSTIPRVETPNLPPPPPPPPPSYTVGGIPSSGDSNPGSSMSGNVGGSVEQIWPWMTVVGE